MESLAAVVTVPQFNEKPDLEAVAPISIDLISTTKHAAANAPMTAAKTMRVDDDVRVVTLGEYKEAAKALAEAFAEDHTCLYFLDTPDRADWTAEQKWDLHLSMFEYITYAHLLKGLVVSSGPNYDCVGLWMPPGANMDDLWTIFRSGMWRLNWQLSREGRNRFFTEFLPLLHDTKAQVLGDRDDDSWYLVYLGTRPASRGRGHARRVVEAVTCRQADRDGKACYLESSAASNVSLYNRLGFKLKKRVYLQREDQPVPLDIMVREPVCSPDSDADSGIDVK